MLKRASKEKRATREGFGEALLEIAKTHPKVVALSADLTTSLAMGPFREAFPTRFFQVGISEAHMMGLAAGMATAGLIPFTGTFANFSTGRVYDQVRQSIAYSSKNVKICASHAGLTLGEDGATHQILEDIGMMRMLPGMTVICPCDYQQTLAATRSLVEHLGPLYLRFGRPKWPVFTTPDDRFVIGEAQHLVRGSDISIFATGHMVWEALRAEEQLAEQGISAEVINIHTIKPIDEAAVIASVQKTGRAICAEEHQQSGGLGEQIARLLAKHHPAPMEQVAVEDSFGESGKALELLQKYGLTAEHIRTKAETLLSFRTSVS